MIEGHGDDSYKYRHPIRSNFSSNVYNKVNLDGLRAHLCGRISAISAYPEPEPYTLEARLADRHALPAASVCVTNGATEAIYLIAQTFRGTNTAILMPTFSEYADACRMHGHKVTSLYTLDAVPEDVHMVWLCNPNNPTGEVRDKKYLTELIAKHPGLFRDRSVIRVFHAERAFYGAGSCRISQCDPSTFDDQTLCHSGTSVGVCHCASGLIGRLRTNRMPWSVNQLAIEAGLYLLSEGIPAGLSMKDYLAECARLKSSLEAIGGLEVWPTDTHFMLVCLRFGKAAALKEYLAREEGILIRDASNFEGLDERFFRIATQTPEENDELVGAIAKWMAE